MTNTSINPNQSIRLSADRLEALYQSAQSRRHRRAVRRRTVALTAVVALMGGAGMLLQRSADALPGAVIRCNHDCDPDVIAATLCAYYQGNETLLT